MNRFAFIVRCWVVLLTLNLSGSLLAQHPPDQVDWDGVTLGSSDYLLSAHNATPAVHLDQGNAWFLSSNQITRMNLRSGKVEASLKLSFFEGRFHAMQYENATHSMLILSGSSKRIQIARLDPNNFEQIESIYTGDDPFEYAYERPMLMNSSKIVPLDGIAHIWALHHGTALRFQKGKDNHYTVSEKIHNVTDLVGIGNDRVVLLNHDGNLQVRHPTGIQKVVRIFEPISDYQLPKSLRYCATLNRIVLSDFWVNEWIAYDCESFKECWKSRAPRQGKKIESNTLTIWGNDGVFLSLTDDGGYLLTFIDLKNGELRDEAFESWPKLTTPRDFPNDPLVLTKNCLVMVFDMENKGIWNQGPFRSYYRNFGVDWVGDSKIVVSGLHTIVYDLGEKEFVEPTYRLNGQYLASSSESHRIATTDSDFVNIYSRDGSLEYRFDPSCRLLDRKGMFGPAGNTFQCIGEDGVFRIWDIDAKVQTSEFWLHRPKEASDRTEAEASFDNMFASIIDGVLPKALQEMKPNPARGSKDLGKNAVRGFIDRNQQMIGRDAPVFSDFMSHFQFDKESGFLLGVVRSNPLQVLRMDPLNPADYKLEELWQLSPYRFAFDSTGTQTAQMDSDYHGEEARPMRTGIFTVRQGDSVKTVRIPDLSNSSDPVFALQDRYILFGGNLVKEPGQYDAPENFLAVFDASDPNQWVMHRMDGFARALAVSPNNQWIAISFQDIIQIRRLATLLPQQRRKLTRGQLQKEIVQRIATER